MLAWLAENILTIVICAGLAALLIAIAVKLVRDKKRGRSSCGCGCANCSMSGMCHNHK